MEILEELPPKQWPLLQEKLKVLWPFNIPGYYTLYVNTKYPRLRETFKFKVYCPYGKMENGVVSINVKNYQEVALFSLSENTSKIEEALVMTRLIDWSRPVYFDLVSSLTLPALKRVQALMHFERFFVTRAKMYHLPGTTKPFTDFKIFFTFTQSTNTVYMNLLVDGWKSCESTHGLRYLSVNRLPDKTRIKSVKPEHIQRVVDAWAFKYPCSDIYFATLASNGLSYGLYSTETDELLAWMFTNEYNYLCHLYCEEKHRRRGYGQYIMQCVVNDLLKDGIDVYGHAVDGNEMPLKIFAKFGFKLVDNAAFLTVENPLNKV